MRNKDFQKFGKRNVHKRKGKERAKAELLRALESVGYNTDGVKIGSSHDGGRRARFSDKRRSDETVASGIFCSSRSGFGFVRLEGREDDIFIPEDRTLGAIDGDYVEVIYHEFRNRFGEKKTEGRIKKILEFGRKSIIGTLAEERLRHGRRLIRRLYILPDDSKIQLRPYVNEDMGAEVGEKVEGLIKRDGTPYPECDIIRIFGAAESREANYEAILADEGITVDFAPAELSEARRAAEEVLSSEGRIDRRGEVIFTIDGAGAKDLDDAVSLTRTHTGYRLGVHIADVSYYVKEKTALDRAVMARGTSIYFTDKVVPMLPEALSNGACSLGADEDKYTLSAEIELDFKGEILSAELTPSIIRSRVRGVYSEVNKLLSGEAEAALIEKYSGVLKSLRLMEELYIILKEKNGKRGGIDFDAPEAEIILDEGGLPIEIIRRERGTSERIIEQFMLTANEAVASLLSKRGIPCVYRIHEEPPADKLSDFIDYVHNLGFDTSVISKNSADPMAFARLLSSAKEKDLFLPVSYTMLRAMSKAKYSEIKKPHFGLGIDDYCHFTSPIRRLSDLATHRIIRRVLFEEKNPKLYASYAKRAATAATEGELRALSAERRIDDLYKVIYMEEHIGESFEGIITSVTSFGMFVELDNTVEGLVPLKTLPGMFVFDEKNLTLRFGEIVFRIGQRVRVVLEEADRIRGKLSFSLWEGEE